MDLAYEGSLLDIYIHDRYETTTPVDVSQPAEVRLREVLAYEMYERRLPFLNTEPLLYGSVSYQGCTAKSDIDTLAFSNRIAKAQKHYATIRCDGDRVLLYELILIPVNAPDGLQWYGASGVESLQATVSPKGFYGLSVKGLWRISPGSYVDSLKCDLLRLTKYSLARLEGAGRLGSSDSALAKLVLQEIRAIFAEIAEGTICSRDGEAAWQDRLCRGMNTVALENITRSLEYLAVHTEIGVCFREFDRVWVGKFKIDRKADQELFCRLLE